MPAYKVPPQSTRATLVVAASTGIAVYALWPAALAGQQMLLHVVAMSVLAPLAVAGWRYLFGRTWQARASQLWAATLVQLCAFLYWHSPAGMAFAMHGAGGALLHASLFAGALAFWWCLAGLGENRAWHGIAALLVTGKLFCLVAVILTFAPRTLYHMMSLADQQLAGLIMITLCPLTYVASALWLCRRWLTRFDVPGPAPS